MTRLAALIVLSCLAALALGTGRVELGGPSVSGDSRLAVGASSAGASLHAPAHSAAKPQALRLQALETRACKPQAPLAVSFDVTPVAGADGLLRVRLEIEPRIELSEVRWSVEVPDGVAALGATQGWADARLNAPTHGSLLLDVAGVTTALAVGPGRPSAAELALVVHGTLPGDEGAESFTRRLVVRLTGSPSPAASKAAPAVRAGHTPEAVLPVAHRSGR